VILAVRGLAAPGYGIAAPGRAVRAVRPGIARADAQPALASGAVDGQENLRSIYTGVKLYGVGQK
jgi:hypothetical protein